RIIKPLAVGNNIRVVFNLKRNPYIILIEPTDRLYDFKKQAILAVLFSGWLYVDATYRGPQWQRWLFKPVTLLLLVGLAWQA
ncbi:hypothetical protein HZD82_24610, partial [Pantoea agglomerans]|nr:hypothetical protein [Pantoea agglomerans]